MNKHAYLFLIIFIFIKLQPNIHTIFIYGPIEKNYIKKDMQFFYNNIKKELNETGNSIEFWPKKIRLSKIRKKTSIRLCNKKEIKNIYKQINIYYEQLRKIIIKNYNKTNQPINLIVIGQGIEFLKNILEDNEIFKKIEKTIIIENKEKVIGNIPNIKKFKIQNLEAEPQSYSSSTSSTKSDLNEENITNQNHLSPNNQLILIDIEEYKKLLKANKKSKVCCCSSSTNERFKTLISFAALIVGIIAL